MFIKKYYLSSTVFYDAQGNRISKLYKVLGASTATYELYVRDATGNIIASYVKQINDFTTPIAIELENHYIYGSQRIGINKNSNKTKMNRQNIHYELTNHLGNVMATIRGAKIQNASGYGYRADIVSTTTYGVFGNTIEEWSYSSNSYKFGFQGQEAENELYGAGDASFFKYRISDNRLGRFFAIDLLAAKYPYNSPYAFSENRVIDGVELEGLEWIDSNVKHLKSFMYLLKPKVTQELKRRFDPGGDLEKHTLVFDQNVIFGGAKGITGGYIKNGDNNPIPLSAVTANDINKNTRIYVHIGVDAFNNSTYNNNGDNALMQDIDAWAHELFLHAIFYLNAGSTILEQDDKSNEWKAEYLRRIGKYQSFNDKRYNSGGGSRMHAQYVQGKNPWMNKFYSQIKEFLTPIQSKIFENVVKSAKEPYIEEGLDKNKL